MDWIFTGQGPVHLEAVAPETCRRPSPSPVRRARFLAGQRAATRQPGTLTRCDWRPIVAGRTPGQPSPPLRRFHLRPR